MLEHLFPADGFFARLFLFFFFKSLLFLQAKLQSNEAVSSQARAFGPPDLIIVGD